MTPSTLFLIACAVAPFFVLLATGGENGIYKVLITWVAVAACFLVWKLTRGKQRQDP